MVILALSGCELNLKPKSPELKPAPGNSIPACKSAPENLHYNLATEYLNNNFPGFSVLKESATIVNCDGGNTAWTKFNVLENNIKIGELTVNGGSNEITHNLEVAEIINSGQIKNCGESNDDDENQKSTDCFLEALIKCDLAKYNRFGKWKNTDQTITFTYIITGLGDFGACNLQIAVNKGLENFPIQQPSYDCYIPLVARTPEDALVDGINVFCAKPYELILNNQADLDTDKDGLTDIYESQILTDDRKPDSDNDGYTDSEEVKTGHDPLLKPDREKIIKEAGFINYQDYWQNYLNEGAPKQGFADFEDYLDHSPDALY